MANVPISAFTVPANTVGIGATGYSLTGSASASFMDLAGTWNTSGTPTAIKLNITDTASNAASLLMDLQVGSASVFRVGKDGNAYVLGGGNKGFYGYGVSTNGGYAINGSAVIVAENGRFTTNASIRFGSTTAQFQWNDDTFLTRRGAANLRLGAADAAAPVAQTLSVQSVVAGTTNTAGQNFTITGSQGTGSGAGGSLIFQVAPANGGGGATVQNPLATALTIASNGAATFSGSVTTSGVAIGANVSIPASGVVTWSGRCELLSPADKVVRIRDNAGTGPAALQSGQFVVANLPAAATYTGSMAFVSDATATTARSTVAGGGANKVMVMSDGANWLIVA